MRAAVDGLADPLSDPLPGLPRPAPPEQDWYDPQALRTPQAPQTYTPDWSVGQSASAYTEPIRRAHTEPTHGYSAPQPPYTAPQPQPQPYAQPQPAFAEPTQPYSPPYEAPAASVAPTVSSASASASAEETVALRIADVAAGTGIGAGSAAPSAASAGSVAASGGVGAPGGRAARRKASRRRGRHGGPGGAQEEEAEQPERSGSDAPSSRMAARRAARERKPGAAVMASRAIGEVFITTGVLMLLFVTYQLWWTNVRAHAQAGSEVSSLQKDWAKGKGNPGTFEPGQGFALLHIPKLDVVVPIAEGTDKKRVLDRGMVGHYAEEGVKTAMPDAKAGNFGLAGHRNTHGEPFRYINRLKPGDEIVVETQDKYFVYKMASILPVTSPSNTSVLDAVPKGSTFKSAGRYITLTTCTPEFTSKYRMIVWGTMVEERSRDKGKPEALVD
ncbi:class E sortase [Streptomyces sp. CWNU-52B]|uniref:class E sortase n=1 Tax=unclassified Streptomyces TaxID=2593676 RepID=UPI0039C0AB0D